MVQWKGRHIAIVVGGIVAVVLLILLGMRRNANILPQALENLWQANTFHTTSELLIHLPNRLRGRERPFTQVTVRIDGDVKRAEGNIPELAGTMYLEARGRGNIFFADGQSRILRDRVLFYLDNLPVFINPSGKLVKRWTEVATPLFGTSDSTPIRQVLEEAVHVLHKTGSAEIDGERLTHYAGQLSEEEEGRLADVLRQSAPGNQGWQVVARLLDANRVKSLEVWVDGGAKEVRRIQAHFVRPLSQGREFDFALLTLTFKDYGKEVTIDVPEKQLTVRPDVFAKLFGGQSSIDETRVEEEKK